MANIKIEYPDPPISPTSYVAASSRYVDSTVVYWSERKILTFKTYQRRTYNFDGNETKAVVKKNEEYRPDKMAYRVFGDPALWWVLMEANGIWDVFDFKSGLNITIPNTF